METPNWVSGVHDKVHLMIGGAIPLLNPRFSALKHCTGFVL